MSKVQRYLHWLWYSKKPYLWFDYVAFSFLWVCSQLYYAVFLLVLKVKKSRPHRVCKNFKIISIGNLAVGGTGKTVFVQFLLKHLKNKKGAVVLRGYRGNVSKEDASMVVSDGVQVFASVRQAGDEAVMLSRLHQVPVVVGKNRAKSCKLLDDTLPGNFDYVLLDDSYQNFQVKKDVSILLIDARYDWGKSYMLPAGFLREKDMSRADIIVLTHAKNMSLKQYKAFMSSVLSNVLVVAGTVRATGLFLCDHGEDVSGQFCGKRILLFAGIGNILGFVESIVELGCTVVRVVDFGDHHQYTKQDVQTIIGIINKEKVDAAITTSKDWHRLVEVLSQNDCKLISLYVLRIEFEFLLPQQYHLFMKVLYDKLGW